MKRLRYLLLLGLLLLAGCSNKTLKYSNNDNAKLTGTITTQDNKTYLNLDEEIIIGDESVNKIEIDYDKDLKNDYKVTIDGTIITNDNSLSLEVKDIEDSLAYINTYSNDIFKFTIPTDIIKLVNVKEITNGYTIYSTNNLDSGGEVVTIKAVTKAEYNKLSKNNKQVIERITSNEKNTIILIYPTTTEYNEKYAKEYATISNHINTLKKSIKLK